MNLSSFKNLVSVVFWDSFSILRYTTKTNPDGTTEAVLDDSPLYNNIPCKISYGTPENPSDSNEDKNPIATNLRIFCGPNVDVLEGDEIILCKLDGDKNVIKQYKGQCGLPAIYATHLEFFIFVSKGA